jgi:hypothetical protein
MKALLLILCPALTFAATITTGVACGDSASPTVSSGSSVQCTAPYYFAAASASMTETGNSLSASLSAAASSGESPLLPYDGGARASATITDSILTQGTGTGYVELTTDASGRWDPDGGTATLQVSVNGTQEILCAFVCSSYGPVFAPITLGNPVFITFTAAANATDIDAAANVGGTTSLLFLGGDQVTAVAISDAATAVPEPSGVWLTLGGLASFGLVALIRVRGRHLLWRSGERRFSLGA